MTKPIPKSLHTVRAVAIMARMAMAAYRDLSAEDAISLALSGLGYIDTDEGNAPDPYGIQAASLKALKAL